MAAVFIVVFTKYAKKLRSLNVFRKNSNSLTAKKCRKCSKLRKSSMTYNLRDEEEGHENCFGIRENLAVRNELWKQAFVYAGR